MLERPNLSDDAIRLCLRKNFGILAARITFLPIGHDAAAWVFRVDATDGRRYFLKTRRGPVREATLAVPHFLRRSGLDAIVAPLATHDGALSVPLDEDFTAVLYPFIEGRVGWNGGLSPRQWARLGAALRRVHGAALPPPLAAQMRRERFAPLKGDLAWALHREVESTTYADPIRRELAAFWQERRGQIEQILLRAEELGRLARARLAPMVLCHADIHTFNVLVDPEGQIFIIDWDETIIAPRERDLMFLLAGAEAGAADVRPNEAAFLRGYGPAAPDPILLAYYRYEWVVQEIAEFGKQVLWAEAGGEITRADGLRHFRALFQPGDVVEGAYASYTCQVSTV